MQALYSWWFFLHNIHGWCKPESLCYLLKIARDNSSLCRIAYRQERRPVLSCPCQVWWWEMITLNSIRKHAFDIFQESNGTWKVYHSRKPILYVAYIPRSASSSIAIVYEFSQLQTLRWPFFSSIALSQILVCFDCATTPLGYWLNCRVYLVFNSLSFPAKYLLFI